MPGNPFAPNQTPVDSDSDQGLELVDAPTEEESTDFELVAAQELANRHLLAELQSLLTTDDFVGNFNDALSLFTEHEEQLDNAYDILALPFLLSQAEEQNRPGILENFCAYYTFKSDLLRQRLKRNLRNQSSMALPLEAASIAATGKTSKDRAKKKLDPFQEKTQKRQTELLDDFTKLKGKLISLTYAAEHFIRIVTDGIFTPAPLSAEALENLKTLNRIAFGLSHLFFSPITVGLTFSNFDEQYRAATARCPRDKFSPLTFPPSGDFSPEIYADLLGEAADRIDTHSPQLASVLEDHQEQIGYIINRQKQHPSHSFIVPRYPLTTQCIMFAAHETVNAKASFFATLRNLIIRGGSKDLYSASATVLERFFAKEIRLDLDEIMVLLNSIAVATKRLSATILETIFKCLSEEWAATRAEFFPGTSAQSLYLGIYNAVAPTWREITSQQKDTKEFRETFPRLTLESYQALLGILDTKAENEDALIFAAELCLTMNPVISSSAKKMPQLLQDAIKILEKINTSEQPQKEFFLNLALNRKLWGDVARDLTYCIIFNEDTELLTDSLIGLTKLMPQLLDHKGPEKLTLSIFAAIFVNWDINTVFHHTPKELATLLEGQQQIRELLPTLMPDGEKKYLSKELARIEQDAQNLQRRQNQAAINEATLSLLKPIYPLLTKFPDLFFVFFAQLSLTLNPKTLLNKINGRVLDSIFSAALSDANLGEYLDQFFKISILYCELNQKDPIEVFLRLSPENKINFIQFINLRYFPEITRSMGLELLRRSGQALIAEESTRSKLVEVLHSISCPQRERLLLQLTKINIDEKSTLCDLLLQKLQQDCTKLIEQAILIEQAMISPSLLQSISLLIALFTLKEITAQQRLVVITTLKQIQQQQFIFMSLSADVQKCIREATGEEVGEEPSPRPSPGP